jgi:hypothetical protein
MPSETATPRKTVIPFVLAHAVSLLTERRSPTVGTSPSR